MLERESFFALVFSPKDNGKVTGQLSSADEANGFLACRKSCWSQLTRVTHPDWNELGRSEGL